MLRAADFFVSPRGFRRLATILGSAVFLFFLLFPTTNVPAFDLADRVYKTTLTNGIRLLVLERDVSPTVSFYIRHRAGAVNEDAGRTGAAHMLEHMMFKGTTTIGTKDFETENRLRLQIEEIRTALKETIAKEGEDSENARLLYERLKDLQEKKNSLIVSNEIDRIYRERGGVDLNAATGYELTSYMVSLPSNALEIWARVESDRLLNPVFREFLPERDVVMEERRQTVHSRPDQQLMELFLGTVFHAHPYGRPIIGWSEDIARLDPAYIRWFFNTYYRPTNMVITIVGDVSTPEVVSLVTLYFGPLTDRREEGALPRYITPEPPQQGERRSNLLSDANPRIIMGFRKPSSFLPEDYVFDVIDAILSRGRSSRLYRTLVTEKKLASNVFTINGLPGDLYENLFVAGADPLEGVSLLDLETAIYTELERLKSEPVSKRELEKAKNQIRSDFFRGMDSNKKLAALLSYYEAIMGDYRYIATYLDHIETIDPEDIKNAASAYFVKRNRTVALLEREERP